MMQEIQIALSTGISMMNLPSFLTGYKSRGHGKGVAGKNYMNPHPTDWKARHAGRVEGVDYGKKACNRRLGQKQIINLLVS